MAICVGLLDGGSASAAGVTGPITRSEWSKTGDPATTSMYEYVPTNLAANPPILVLVHYCGGNAAGVFGEAQGGGIVAAADKYGFLMVVPQTSNNCWDIATTASLTHNGGGDSGAIINMVKYAITKHNANANRVYVTGTSSGAMMAEGLAGVYPEVFKASSEFAGVPAGCWAVNDPAGQWSGPCAGGQVTHTAAEWGDMVRKMYPGYTGPRPRIQLWHGQADSIISYTNQTEAIKEWTNVLGLSMTATTKSSVTISGHQYNRQEWKDSCGLTVLDEWTEVNGPHGTDANLNATYTIPFFALDKVGPTDPQATGCGTDGGAAGGSGGSGSGGSSAVDAGATGTGGITTSGEGGSTTGTGGSNPTGAGGASGGSGGTRTETGTGGTTTGAGGSTEGGGGVTPSRPGCSCELAQGPRAADTFAWAGFVVAVVFARRRAKRSARR